MGMKYQWTNIVKDTMIVSKCSYNHEGDTYNDQIQEGTKDDPRDRIFGNV